MTMEITHKYHSYIEPQVLEMFLTWLEEHGYKIEYKIIDNEKMVFINDIWQARFGPFKTFEPHTRPYKQINATARLSYCCDEKYDEFIKSQDIKIPERLKLNKPLKKHLTSTSYLAIL